MARNLDEAIAEEEEREVEEAEDFEEQEHPKEYEDEKGENIAPTTGMAGRSYLEFVCVKCGTRSPVRHLKTTGVHCGRKMLVVDREEKKSYPFGHAAATRMKARVGKRKAGKTRGRKGSKRQKITAAKSRKRSTRGKARPAKAGRRKKR